jgi:UDP-N-acetylglucosamine--N-acetylmuramyl-(pentapeptide) pyrophosphoryl-undecaprenol N-acetylglucosamine transferase
MLSVVKSGIIPTEWQILWQIGERNFSEVASSIPDSYRGKYLPFIYNMPGAYSATDLIISRAGAMALAEIAAWGLPSILIPYPYATGDHQTLNAIEFTLLGAGVVIPESEAERRLPLTLEELMTNSERRSSMAAAARELARPEAATIIANAVLEKIDEIQEN